ncbi:MAG TPA: hypothetical protein VN258_12750 [Mobilitalea sp.]|nr:hypothetical protein [Mobilitalea sp.]
MDQKHCYHVQDFIRNQQVPDIAAGIRTSIEYLFPDCNGKGFYNFGMDTRNDDTVDLREFQALELWVAGKGISRITVKALFGKDGAPSIETNIGRSRGYAKWSKEVYINQSSQLVVNLKDFDDQITRSGAWRFVKGFVIESDQNIEVLRITLSRGLPFYLKSDVYSKSGKTGQVIKYQLELGNCSEEELYITFDWKRYGWESMELKLPDNLILAPYEIRTTEVEIQMNELVAPGGYEAHTLTATPNGNGVYKKECTFLTQKYMEHPYIVGTEDIFNETRQKINDQEWAKETLEQYIQMAEQYEVPEVDPTKSYMFVTENAHIVHKIAITWKLTGRAEFLEKVILFLRRLTNEKTGYLTNLRACHQELVHEGEFFHSTAIAYDIVSDSQLLTKEDHSRIEKTFRKFIEIADFALLDGNISNWTLAEMTGALFCSLALQDRERAERFLFGIGGMKDHMSIGVLDDGWWYEVSIGYNQLAAGLFTKMHLAMKPWGYNLKDMWVPSAYTKQLNKKSGSIDGLVIEAWGPRTKNYRNLEMQWDSMVPFCDERGIVFGLSDSAESKLAGTAFFDPRYDAAYYLFRKPAYAKVVKLSNEGRDLLYGVAQLPDTLETEIPSCYADNAGVTWLRSQKKGRNLREQIAVSVKYGCHGGAHGHYDRTAMNSLIRYGKSLYNPENVWHGYKTFLYKFYVQNSITHNMVTVDLKQQDPKEAKRLLFYAGNHIQACVVENETCWCNPPYGGWRVYDEKTFPERAWKEGRYVNIPEEAPQYTVRTDYTEPVLQRRATVVTDYYVVNFDYLEGTKEHDYHCIYHLKGLKQIEGAVYTGSRELLDDSCLSSGQFITDVKLYEYEHGAMARFCTEFQEFSGETQKLNPDRTLYNDTGSMAVDVYSVYPEKANIVCAHVPESYILAKQLFYQITGDDRCLAEGAFGAWVLGRDEIDISVEGIKQLSLKVRVNQVELEYYLQQEPLKTIFWGDPYLMFADGTKLYLSEVMEDKLITGLDNLDYGMGIGKDYYGGSVKLQAKQYDKAIPAEPDEIGKESRITISLEQITRKYGNNPIRLYSAIGGDFPPGKEEQNRLLYALHQRGKRARFITVLEPYEEKRMISSVQAVSENEIKVNLVDGRYQHLRITGFDRKEEKIKISFSEYRQDICTIAEETK